MVLYAAHGIGTELNVYHHQVLRKICVHQILPKTNDQFSSTAVNFSWNQTVIVVEKISDVVSVIIFNYLSRKIQNFHGWIFMNILW